MRNISERLLSLDVFRGLTVAGMILVNLQGEGGGFGFLHHSSWDGCSFADLVFPFFLFIVGAAIFFAMKKSNYELNSLVVKKILLRGFWIFFIGFLQNIIPFTTPIDSWRIFGVLQRIAIVYVSAAFLVLWLKSFNKILILSGAILLGYWILTSVTGHTFEHNLAMKIDHFLIGGTHMYTPEYEPEGILSTFPAIVNALLGYLTSMYLVEVSKNKKSLIMMVVAGGIFIALALCWDLVHPMNKKIWTSSYTLFSSGIAMLTWAILYYIIDIKKKTRWSTFSMVFGTNALFAFILSEFLLMLNMSLPITIDGQTNLLNVWLDRWIYSSITTTPLRSALWGITVLAVCWGVSFILYKRKIFIKL